MAKYFIFKNDTGENPVRLFKIASSDEEKNFIINNRQFQMNSIVVSDNDFNNAKLGLFDYTTTDYNTLTSTSNVGNKVNSQMFTQFNLPILLENIQRYIFMNNESEKQSYMQGWKDYLSTLRGLNTTTLPKHFDVSFENYLNSLGINFYNYNYQSY
jgi:hypothetical protein